MMITTLERTNICVTGEDFALKRVGQGSAVFQKGSNEQIALPLHKGLTLMMGQSGSGKSTLLKLITEQALAQDMVGISVNCFREHSTYTQNTVVIDLSKCEAIKALSRFTTYFQEGDSVDYIYAGKLLPNIKDPITHSHVVFDLSSLINDKSLVIAIFYIIQYLFEFNNQHSNKSIFLHIDEIGVLSQQQECSRRLFDLLFIALQLTINVGVSLQSPRDFLDNASLREVELLPWLNSVYIFRQCSLSSDWVSTEFYKRIESLEITKDYSEFIYLDHPTTRKLLPLDQYIDKDLTKPEIQLYKKKKSLLVEKEGLKQQYLSLLNKVIDITKNIKSVRARGAIIESIKLPKQFSSYYLDLVLSIRSAKEKIPLLSSIFSKLADTDKILAREVIRKQFAKITNEKRKLDLLCQIFDTKDKELILGYKNEVQNIPSSYLKYKCLLVLDISLFLDEIAAKELQNQVLLEILATDNIYSIYYDLAWLLNRELLGEIKQKAIVYACENWSNLNCAFKKKLCLAPILKHLPDEIAHKIFSELYQEIKRVNKNRNDKTTEVEMLLTLGDNPSSPHFSSLCKEAISIVKQLGIDPKIKTSINTNTIYHLAFILQEDLALEFADVLVEKFQLSKPPHSKLLIIWLFKLLEKVSKKFNRSILYKITLQLALLKVTGDTSFYLNKSVETLNFLLPEDQKSAANKLLALLVIEQDEKQQANLFGRLIKYLPINSRKIILTAIEQMKSAKYKAIALAKVLYVFEGKEFISFAESLLEMESIPFDENEIQGLIRSLINSIGQKLDS